MKPVSLDLFTDDPALLILDIQERCFASDPHSRPTMAYILDILDENATMSGPDSETHDESAPPLLKSCQDERSPSRKLRRRNPFRKAFTLLFSFFKLLVISLHELILPPMYHF